MSDPKMAKAMERDMRTKFFIALPLTILTVLYAPLGINLLGLQLPTFGLDMNVIMLVLSTPVDRGRWLGRQYATVLTLGALAAAVLAGDHRIGELNPLRRGGEPIEIATFQFAGWKRGMHLRGNPNLTLDLAVNEGDRVTQGQFLMQIDPRNLDILISVNGRLAPRAEAEPVSPTTEEVKNLTDTLKPGEFFRGSVADQMVTTPPAPRANVPPKTTSRSNAMTTRTAATATHVLGCRSCATAR